MTEHRLRLPLFHTVFVICVLVAAGLFGVVLWTVSSLSDQVASARTDRDALIKQVEGLGAEPVVTPPPGEPGPQGDPGVVGPRGPRGEQGPPGRDGEDGPPGPVGQRGPQGLPGLLGEPGSPGTDGQDGSDGTDGQQGPQGEPGLAGPQGEQGPAGVDGRDGQDGAPGPPVASWTYTDQLGTTYRCTDPDGDLAYTCEPVEQPPLLGG